MQIKMPNSLSILSLALCSLTLAQRPPVPRPDPSSNTIIAFPRESDIVFPETSESSESRQIQRLFKLVDFTFNSRDNVPSPKPPPRHRMPPNKPGQPFPPPPNGRRQKKRKSRRRICEHKYSEYIERIFPNDTAVAEDANDDEFDGRVLARPGQYPHMAALGFEMNLGSIEYKCGGSLISENFVLTAAHCTDVEGVSPKWVRIGGLNLMMPNEANVESQNIGISSISRFPDYTDELNYNDIALLQLERNVVLTEFVRPIRLWVSEEIPTSIAFAMGYGSTSFSKSMTNRLTHLNVTIVPNDECNGDLPSFAETPDGILDSQICAQDFILNRDTCQGDSGGPLQLNLPGRRRRHHIHYHLIGITSYGVFCRSSFPSVYTRVFTYLDWIERVTWGSGQQ